MSTRHAKLLVCVFGLVVAGFDYFSPGEINAAIFYSLPIGVCAWTRSRRWLWGAACLFGVLTLLRYLSGAPPLDLHYTWVDSTNRYLTLCALVLVAGLVHWQMRSDEALRATREHLEERVRQRTRELEQANSDLLRQARVVRELSGRLLAVQDDERRRVARELHDSVGQSLAAAGMLMTSIQGQGRQLPRGAAKALGDAVALIEEVQREIRTLSYLLHPPLLDEIGLRSALRWYTDGFSERSGIRTTLELPAEFPRLPADLELCIFRIVQECLTNIHRHSGSEVALVRIVQQNQCLCIEVKDQGRGFAADKQNALAAFGSQSVGIPGMRERLRPFGGALEIASDAAGTSVMATIPVTLPAGEAEKVAIAAARSAD